MTYLSVCSGIEAATVAWRPLGWHPLWFAETARFPAAVLAAHYPDVVNRGDMTRFAEWPDAVVDVLVGGTPCQSFSVAGLRAGVDDPRGALLLVYLAVARRYRPRWLVWENVPGVLSSDDGRAFGALLGGLAKLGYGFAYRVLDAQYFDVAQRRARVFVVACAGDWRRAAAVLFERASLSGHPAPRGDAGEATAAVSADGIAGDGRDPDDLTDTLAGACSAKWAKGTGGPAGDECYNLVTDAPAPFADLADPVAANQARTWTREGTHNFRLSNVARHGARVRRFTPREVERLQGFPDDYTRVPYRGRLAKDGPRYMALGNSIAVPVLRWIGARIAQVEALG